MKGDYQKYAHPQWAAASVSTQSRLKLAAICDRFTWANLEYDFDAVYLSPDHWRDQLEATHPDIFFCEAAWEGLDGRWINEIYRNSECPQDNRTVLNDILKYCQKAGIPTVFWNKEDTPKFEDKPFSFIETALLFDHIFTTAIESIPKYRSLGHRSVHLMMFGYSPHLFSVCAPRPKTGIAVFLGSWYGSNRERCKEMCRMFDMVLEQGLELRIYDRLFNRNEPDRQFPPKYAPYILPAVSYEQTGAVMNEADYVININSVMDSQTMFARRVFEAMACGRIVISNHSVGLQNRFADRIWFIDQPFDHKREEEIISENLKTVETHYTFRAQMIAALNAAHLWSKE